MIQPKIVNFTSRKRAASTSVDQFAYEDEQHLDEEIIEQVDVEIIVESLEDDPVCNDYVSEPEEQHVSEN
jgi:hypothetical protein